MGKVTGPQPSGAPLRRALVVIHGASSDVGRRFDLLGRALTIGRGRESDIWLCSPSVSRAHATLLVQEDGVTLEDEGSANGTFVDDERISRTYLRARARVAVGHTVLRYLEAHDLEAAYASELFSLSLYDGLTRARNARYWLGLGGLEVSRARRYERPLSVLTLAVGGSAASGLTVAERESQPEARPASLRGHMQDVLMRLVAERILPNLRRADVLARLDAHHFSILLPETDEVARTRVTDKLLDLVAGRPFSVLDQTVLAEATARGASLRPGDDDWVQLRQRAGCPPMPS